MTKTKKLLLSSIMALTAILLLIAVIVPKNSAPDGSDIKNAETSLLSDETAMTDIIKDGQSKYNVIFAAADDTQADTSFATELVLKFRSYSVLTTRYQPDTVAETPYEILIGETNRALSKELMAAVRAAEKDDNLVWAIAERNGQIAYLANTSEAFARGQADLLSFFGESSAAIPTGTWKVFTLSQEEIKAEIAADRQRQIDELKAKIADFEYSDFGDAPGTSMPGASYGTPAMYPEAGVHPRVNVTSYMIPDILAYMETEEASYTVTKFWEIANKEYDGILPAATEQSGRTGVHNMDESGLGIIEAKAFAYLLTGDELYAYQAIYAMKNFLTTIDIQWIHSDQCREFGRIMYCTAEVYDWCYDLLSAEDKAQFIMACADIGSSQNQNTDFGNQMEVGFPPKLQGCVSGHGSEHQVLRDYLSIAIAVFDEDPTWYEWVGGMVYNYFVPFRDYYFVSGTYPQGMNCYAPHRFDADLWSAWLLMCATGEIPYSADFARVTQSFFQNETPNGTFFSTGDGSRLSSGSSFWHHATVSSALYGDAALRAQMMKFTSNMTSYSGHTVSFSFAHMLILSTSYYNKVGSNTESVDRFDGVDPVCYFGSPLGQMTVRSAWNDENAAATFMKLGERTTANHEHADAGTFQIFYKGLYTGDSGQYDKYGSTHWTYYHTQTVAHNGLLIADPERIGTDPEVLPTYYYSGGQRKLTEANNLATWLDSAYDTGTVTGVEWAYNTDGTTDYAYLGGDITAAYDQTAVSYVGRRMLTIYTGDEEAPMYFIVCDDITSRGEDFKKTFLLHTTNEPVVNEQTRTVESIESNGRLVLRSLLGGDSIEAIGGEGMTFAINGNQCATQSGWEGSIWGRVEISPTSEALSHTLLNFMYVTDASSKLMLEPELLTAEHMNGLIIDDLVVIFADNEGENNSSELTFSTEGTGLSRFIVLGMFEGTWNVSVDGVTVAHSVASAEGGMLSFYAPAGNIAITPGKDIAPANGGRIIYSTAGGLLPEDAPLVYEIGVPVTLPTEVVNGLDRFIGWYTTPTFDEGTEITELIATEKGKVTIYAKYSGVAVDETYEDIEINANRGTFNGISYLGKDGSRFVTETDEKTANTYLHLTRGTLDPQIDIAKDPDSYLYGETKITLVIDLARDDSTPLGSICRIRAAGGSADTVPYFTTQNNGNILLGGKTVVMTLTEVFQTLAVTMDFETGVMTGYDAVGNILATVRFSAPEKSGCSSTSDWLPTIITTVNWWMSSGETILIDNLNIYAGDYVPRPVVIPEGYAKINYQMNGGSFLSSVDTMYKEGEITLLEPNVIKGTDEFLGWYTTPDFKAGTKIAEISADRRGDITVYAKWAGKIMSADFEGETFDVTEGSLKVDGMELAGTDKAGTVFKAVTDSDNTYLYWNRGTSDPQVKYSGKINSFPGRHVATYRISLATVKDETPMSIDFRVRSTQSISSESTLNYISLFSTNANGEVKLGGKTLIATLNSSYFTEIVVSIDFEQMKLIAYDPFSGLETASVDFAIENYGEWLDVMNLPIYIYAMNGQSIRLDDISIHAAPFSAEEEISTSLGKIDYVLGGGSFDEEPSRYYTKGEAMALPTPTKTNSVFLGWYKDAGFTEPITEITEEDTDNFILYAYWRTVMLDYDAEKYDINYEGKEDNSLGSVQEAGLSMQTKGEDSFYKTLEDDAGNRYLLWSKGAGDPQIMFSGNLASKASNSPILTITVSMASNDGSFVGVNARMRTGTMSDGKRREIPLFAISQNGLMYLARDTSLAIGQFGDEFKTLGIVVNFSNGMLYGYNELGEKVCECVMTLPTDFASYDELYQAITGDILGFYAGGSSKTTVRVKSIRIETGNSYEVSQETADPS